MRKKYGMEESKRILFLIVITIAIALLLLNTSIQISPYGQTTSRYIVFEWKGYPSLALVDDNPYFTSPIEVEKNQVVELEPDTYYWKVKGISRKRQFTIVSEITLEAKADVSVNETKYQIKNAGNVKILLSIKRMIDNLFTGYAILDIGESVNLTINQSSKISAEQNEA